MRRKGGGKGKRKQSAEQSEARRIARQVARAERAERERQERERQERSERAKKGWQTRRLHEKERARIKAKQAERAKAPKVKPRKGAPRQRTFTGNLFALFDALAELDQNRRGRVTITAPFFYYRGRVGDGDLYNLDIKRAADEFWRELTGMDPETQSPSIRLLTAWKITQYGFNGASFSGLRAKFIMPEDAGGEEFNDEVPF